MKTVYLSIYLVVMLVLLAKAAWLWTQGLHWEYTAGVIEERRSGGCCSRLLERWLSIMICLDVRRHTTTPYYTGHGSLRSYSRTWLLFKP